MEADGDEIVKSIGGKWENEQITLNLRFRFGVQGGEMLFGKVRKEPQLYPSTASKVGNGRKCRSCHASSLIWPFVSIREWKA